jgi:hypothetical protein
VINLIFPDGSIVSGATFAEVEEALRATQWHTFKSRREFRREMRRRAALWSGRAPKPLLYQTPKAFIYQLVHSGMCMLEEGEPRTTTDNLTRIDTGDQS